MARPCRASTSCGRFWKGSDLTSFAFAEGHYYNVTNTGRCPQRGCWRGPGKREPFLKLGCWQQRWAKGDRFEKYIGDKNRLDFMSVGCVGWERAKGSGTSSF